MPNIFRYCRTSWLMSHNIDGIFSLGILGEARWSISLADVKIRLVSFKFTIADKYIYSYDDGDTAIIFRIGIAAIG